MGLGTPDRARGRMVDVASEAKASEDAITIPPTTAMIIDGIIVIIIDIPRPASEAEAQARGQHAGRAPQ